MRAIWRVFIKEVRENLRDRRTVISALIFGPLFGPLLVSSALSLSFRDAGTQDSRPLHLTVSHAERAPELMAYLRQYNVRIRAVEEDQAAARREVAAHHGEEVLLVPDDFGSRLEAGQPAPLLLFADESDTKSAASVERLADIVNQYGTHDRAPAPGRARARPAAHRAHSAAPHRHLDTGGPLGAGIGDVELSGAADDADGRHVPRDRRHRR